MQRWIDRPRKVNEDIFSKLPADTRSNINAHAGQSDTADDSHFTFVIDCDGKSTTYDGWLQKDDSVIIEPR